MTMHHTKAPRASKSRRYSALEQIELTQMESFTVQSVRVPVSEPHRAARAAGRRRPGGLSFGSFSQAKATLAGRSHSQTVPGSTGRRVVPDALERVGFFTLGAPGDAPPAREHGESGRSALAADQGGEELPPLVPLIVSANPNRAGRFQLTRAEGRSRVLRIEPTPTPTPAPVRVAAPVSPVPSRRPRTRRLRLTMRGHVAVMLMIATAIAGTSALVNASRADKTVALPPSVSQEIVVRPGDTVQTIAARVAPADQQAEVAALIRAANGLSGSEAAPLHAGDYLLIPSAKSTDGALAESLAP